MVVPSGLFGQPGKKSREEDMEEILVNNIGQNAVNIVLNRPDKKNALNYALINKLAEYLESLEKNPEIKLVILTGSNGDFCAGVDVDQMYDQDFPAILINNMLNEKWHKLSSFKKPLIAAVNGYCLGGGLEIAMMCDFIIADETAVFGQPEIKLGLMPGLGGTQRLAKYLGKSLSADMCLTGRFIKAKEAFDRGLISRLVAKGELENIINEYVSSISNKPLQALMMIKKSLKAAANNTSLEVGLDLEQLSFYGLFSNSEIKNLMDQFRKR